eukprot:477276-Hanusia_phi.AAC.4
MVDCRISLKLPPPSFLSALTRTHETPLVCEVIKLLIVRALSLAPALSPCTGSSCRLPTLEAST